MRFLYLSLVSLLFLGSCQAQKSKDNNNLKSKQLVNKPLIKGFNFTGTSYKMKDYSTFDSLKALGSNWVSFSPFFYMKNSSSAFISDTFPRQWFGESKYGVSVYSDSAHSKGMKVLVNPHIWIMNGTFTGDLNLSETEREKWERSYKSYLVECASLCEQHQVEMLSIGNELKTPIKNNNAYWLELIDTLRNVYSGKLSYASNWDNVSQIPFWDKLDYISVNAYFPLSDKENATADDLKNGWKKWQTELQSLKTKYKKPILFTELGYQSVKNCYQKPWEYGKGTTQNEDCQSLAFQVFFNEVLGKECDGVFIWKWFDSIDTHKHDHYSPQGKKAMNVINDGFKK